LHTVLVNNAGIVHRKNEQGTDARAHFVDTFNINVAGVAIVMDSFIPLLRKSQDSRIVNLSSRVGSISNAARSEYPITDQIGYNVSKTALNRLTIDYTKLYRDISFYCVCPGYCKTNLNGYDGFKDPLDGGFVVQELVQAKKGKYGFGFYHFDHGKMRTCEW
jgi:NAD(P)-dependent dehydrogenase (short-subunit alcohol dehydrogenase family)